MELETFVDRLDALTGDDIADVAVELRREFETADGELCWWRATIAVGANLKRHHRSREAGLAAHRASVAVVRAADKADMRVSKDDVTLVARAASEVARVLVADQERDVPQLLIGVLVAPWRTVVAVAA
ncbi:MAG TPA: hypothetical protein VFV00_08820 [Acidimicrobiales bacterium]|nr:hypothetical protein [Acidimicrobiales bacterium]